MVVEKIRTSGLKVPVVEGLIVTRGHCVTRVAYGGAGYNCEQGQPKPRDARGKGQSLSSGACR